MRMRARVCGVTQDALIHQVDAYCSKDCQVWAWKAGHKEECVAGKGAQLRAETDAQIQVEIDNMKLKADGTPKYRLIWDLSQVKR